MFKFFKELRELRELREQNKRIKAENEAKEEAERIAKEKELEEKRYQDELKSINFTSKLDKSNIKYYKLTDDEIQKYKDEIEYVINNVKHEDATTTKVLVTAYKNFDFSVNYEHIQSIDLTTEIVYFHDFHCTNLEFLVNYNNDSYYSLTVDSEQKWQNNLLHFENHFISFNKCYYDYSSAFIKKMGFSNKSSYIIHLMMLYCPPMIFSLDDSLHSVDTILKVFKTYNIETMLAQNYSRTSTDITDDAYFKQEFEKLKNNQ